MVPSATPVARDISATKIQVNSSNINSNRENKQGVPRTFEGFLVI